MTNKTNTPKKPTLAEDKFSTAIQNSEIPKLYANGVLVGTGLSDVLLILEQNGQSIATLNLSYTMAKTLAIELSSAISTLEKQSDNTIMTFNDVQRFLGGPDGTDGKK